GANGCHASDDVDRAARGAALAVGEFVVDGGDLATDFIGALLEGHHAPVGAGAGGCSEALGKRGDELVAQLFERGDGEVAVDAHAPKVRGLGANFPCELFAKLVRHKV